MLAFTAGTLSLTKAILVKAMNEVTLWQIQNVHRIRAYIVYPSSAKD
jgi:hypothetical protein